MNKKIRNLVLVGALVVLLGVRGYFAWYREAPTTDQDFSVSTLPQPTQPTQLFSLPDTSSWKTFTHERIGYTIKYPPDWTYKFPDPDISVSTFVCFGKELRIVAQNIEGGSRFRCDGDNLIIVATTPGEIGLEGTLDYRKKIDPSVQFERFIADGEPGMTIYNTYGTESFFNHNDNGYNVNAHSKYGNYASLKPIHETMLSTFRFLPPVPPNGLSARQVLINYLSLLNEKKYSQAIKYYVGDYSILREWNPLLDPSDHVGLFQSACEHTIRCLKIRKILKEEIVPFSADEYKFVVELANEDGTLFKRGPCCGASEEDEPTETSFEFSVRKFEDNFLVMDLPVYVP